MFLVEHLENIGRYKEGTTLQGAQHALNLMSIFPAFKKCLSEENEVILFKIDVSWMSSLAMAYSSVT